MRTEDLDFPLPEELIALHPPAERTASRLMAVDCAAGEWRHLGFRDLPALLRPGDLLVLNDTRVVPARIVARKPTGGRVEGLWLGERPDGRGLFLLSGSRLRPGTELHTANGGYRLRLTERVAPGRWLLEDESGRGWLRLLAEAGATPLPPYIRSRRERAGEPDDSPEDRARYQTVFAARDGAVAAPTAGLHFDQELLVGLRAAGVATATLTLHVGEGTFLPVTTERLEDHPMHAERYEVPAAARESIERTRAAGGRIVAAGTTVCRALESFARDGRAAGATELFLRPGSRFLLTDALLTNFHTPRSTLLALVAAFAEQRGAPDGLALVKRAYAAAVARRYRFYSYGDASFWC
ncbi:MAG: tRNA preQ1(34) S-adenosylmethionine ribosyltransferase-isomerase QueA [Planctomycetota bacterium]|nr:MAG: tRNA preQ1(34) S-adenosylmethionine ribosyltransferase-isomerase QueA [Planctomycetota bacterium]